MADALAVPYTVTIATPVGRVTLTATADAVTGLGWARRAVPDRPNAVLDRAAAELRAYFAGALKAFTVALAPAGSDHELRVWDGMCRIPYGETVTYGELARRTGSNPRAVGQACGANPIAIIVPCHRVTAANGTLGGYSGAGGVVTKRHLLGLEDRCSGAFVLRA